MGLPKSFGGSKVSVLKYLKERLNHKTTGWQTNFISYGGKEILLKAVAQAFPTYKMSCFLLPKITCQQILSTMANFWWRNKADSKCMHWKAWEHLCKPKVEGGLGFKDMEDFSLALLGKQLWRMATQDNLMTKVFKGRYFWKTNPLDAPLGSRPWYAWKSIHAAQNLIRRGARRTVGNGQNSFVWKDPWLNRKDPWLNRKPAHPPRYPAQIQPQAQHLLSDSLRICDIMEPNGREWNSRIVESLFTNADRELLKEIRHGSSITRYG